MRVLVSFQESHYSYGEAIARALEHLRPSLEVSVAGSEALAEEVSRLRPDVVISDRPKGAGAVAAWVQIPTDLDPMSSICVGGGCRRSQNPSFDELLAVVDEADSLPG